MHYRHGNTRRLSARHSFVNFFDRAHARRKDHGKTSLDQVIEQERVGNFTRRHLPGLDADPQQHARRFERKRRTEKLDFLFFRVSLEPEPLLLGELHAFPVVVARGVLIAETNTPRLLRGALGLGNVGLKFDGVGSRFRDGIDIRMRRPQAAVMRLRHFSDNQTAIGVELHD